MSAKSQNTPTQTPTRKNHQRRNQRFAEALSQILPRTRLLLVGVGGIGCELLKLLSKSALANLTLIDLDRVELSNLSRQFYFRAEHIGLPKASAAAAALALAAPQLPLSPLDAPITCSLLFPPSFFRAFDAVLLALDNAEARSHVNRLCVREGVPVFESGTAGFAGQTFPVLPKASRCYDCFPRPAAKSVQVCTIRTLPAKAEHCLFWAKNVINNVFGEKVADNSFSIVESRAKMLEKFGTNFPLVLLKSLFCEGVAQLRESGGERFAHLRALEEQVFHFLEQNFEAFEHFEEKFCAGAQNVSVVSSCSVDDSFGFLPCGKTDVENQEENVKENTEENENNHKNDCKNDRKIENESAKEVCEKRQEKQAELDREKRLALNHIFEAHKILSKLQGREKHFYFDKDDEEHVSLLTALSNLRAFNFSIPTKSKQEARKLVGEIVPAICATNSLVAGLLVQELFKFLVKANYVENLCELSKRIENASRFATQKREVQHENTTENDKDNKNGNISEKEDTFSSVAVFNENNNDSFLLSLRNFELFVSNFHGAKITKGNLTSPAFDCSVCKGSAIYAAMNFSSRVSSLKKFLVETFGSDLTVFKQSVLLFEVDNFDEQKSEQKENRSENEEQKEKESESEDEFDFERELKTLCAFAEQKELEFLIICSSKENQKVTLVLNHENNIKIGEISLVENEQRNRAFSTFEKIVAFDNKVKFFTAKERKSPKKRIEPHIGLDLLDVDDSEDEIICHVAKKVRVEK